MNSLLKNVLVACIFLASIQIFGAESKVAMPIIKSQAHVNLLNISNQELTDDGLRNILNASVNYQGEAVPLKAVPNLILDISSNKLVTLPDELMELDKMIYLNAQSNNLVTLPEQMSGLKSVRIMHLTDNSIKSLGGIAQLKKLEELWLCSNSLRTLPEALANLSNLHALDLSFNDLTDIPSVLFQLHNLKILFLHGNYLARVKDLQTAIAKLPALCFKSWIITSRKELLPHLKVTIIPPNSTFLNFSEFNLIDINGINQLHVLAENKYTPIRLLNNLILKLSSNQLIELPQELFLLRSILSLNLSNNKLLGLQSWIENLNNLLQLDLSWNQLSSLPDSIGTLQNLNSLFVNNNRLTSIPDSIGNLSNLEQLDIQHNELQELPFEALLKLNKLKNLKFDLSLVE